MKNVHLLQTETYLAKLQLDRDYGTLTIFDEPCISNGQDFVGANLYITSDENIKDVRPHKGKWQLEDGLMLNKFPTYLTDLSECKLVIMTTDQNLIADGVQKIDDEFLEWFVQNSSFAIPIVTTTVNGKSLYRTNIGFESWKKEESKQETLLGKTISKKDADKDSFEDVTKYKVERNYSELVDLLERLTTIYREGSDLHQKYDKKRLEFIEQLKNDNENK